MTFAAGFTLGEISSHSIFWKTDLRVLLESKNISCRKLIRIPTGYWKSDL
jgi:hypothetical protein